jgi:hypothetical protein
MGNGLAAITQYAAAKGAALWQTKTFLPVTANGYQGWSRMAMGRKGGYEPEAGMD